MSTSLQLLLEARRLLAFRQASASFSSMELTCDKPSTVWFSSVSQYTIRTQRSGDSTPLLTL